MSEAALLAGLSIAARIEAVRSRLTPSERKVAALLAEAPELGTLAQFARAAGVAEPSVLRFCRAIGLEGYAPLRNALMREAAAPPRPPPARAIAPGLPLEEVPAALLDGAEAALGQLRAGAWAREAGAALQPMALALLRASRVEIWAMGEAAPWGEILAQRLHGTCRAPTARADSEAMTMVAAALEPGAALLCLDPTGTRGAALLAPARRAVAESGATWLAAAPPGSALAAEAGLLLPCPAAGGVAARLAPLLLVESLAAAAGLLASPAPRSGPADPPGRRAPGSAILGPAPDGAAGEEAPTA